MIFTWGTRISTFPARERLLRLCPERPDIIHAHNLHGGYFDLRYLVPLGRRVPVILNLRDMWLLTGHCAYPMECTRWKSGCGGCPDLNIFPRIRRDATAFNWQRKRKIYHDGRFCVATVSQWSMNQVRASMLAGVESRLIVNAIDLGVFSPGSQSEARRQIGLPAAGSVVVLSAQTQFKDYAMMETALRALKNKDGAGLRVCLSGETRRSVGSR